MQRVPLNRQILYDEADFEGVKIAEALLYWHFEPQDPHSADKKVGAASVHLLQRMPNSQAPDRDKRKCRPLGDLQAVLSCPQRGVTGNGTRTGNKNPAIA